MSTMDMQRQKDDEEALEHQVTVDGHKLKLRDIFSDAYGAKEFRTKLKLLHSKSSGEPDMEGPEFYKSVEEDRKRKAKEEMELEDRLFKGRP